MSFDFLHPLMLAGLAGVALPLLAHLLSRKKYEVVRWGAMQFLELGRKTRRRIRLEELLLMALRMGLIALLAIALARPWASGGMLASLISKQARDVVFVIDGSYSMGWEGKSVTPHAAAIQWAHDFLEELRPGDSIAILDARDKVRPVIESPTSDFGYVREQLSKLPAPAGSSDLADAAARGVQILSRTSNLAREVIVLTDGQARGWSPRDENLWVRFDDLRRQPAVEPRIWLINVADDWDAAAGPAGRVNFGVDRLQLSRDLTVANFPIRIKTKVRAAGGEAPTTRRVHLEVNGQRLAEKSLQVQLEPGGEASVEFEHRFSSTGSHLVSVVLDDDNLPGDNRSDAAVAVAEAVSVLLVDGDPNLDDTRSETFFARAALTATSNDAPWVRATVVAADRFSPDQLKTPEVVVLANVPRLSESQAGGLADFVSRGGGLCVALGDHVDAAEYNRRLFDSGKGLMPYSLESIETASEVTLPGSSLGTRGVRVTQESLDLPWMTRFRTEQGGTLHEARFTSWWQTSVGSAPIDRGNARMNAGTTNDGAGVMVAADGPQLSAAIVAARLETGDPLLISRAFGRGNVLLMTSSLDADWSTLPAKADFVPLLHEMIFHLASGRADRNVDVGTPLILPVAADFPVEEFAFFGPGETVFDAQPGGDELRPLVRLNDTRLPGVYELRHRTAAGQPSDGGRPETFVVNSDRAESDLTPLDDAERDLLATDGRMEFIDSREQLREQMFADSSRTEFWQLLLFVFLGILVAEVVMTRRLVQGGHVEASGE